MNRVNLEIAVKASDAESGAVFWEEGKKLNGLKYADFVDVQGLLLQLQAQLHEKGKINSSSKSK